MSGGTNWTSKEESCLAWTHGRRDKQTTYAAWQVKRVAVVPDLYYEPTDLYEKMFDLGRLGTPMYDSLEQMSQL